MPRRAATDNVVKLTKTGVAALTLEAGQGERIVWDAEVRGFGVRIRSSGNRAWVIRPPRSGGASKLHTLGSVAALDLLQARRVAQGKLAEAALGGDPTADRKQARAQAAVTLGGLVDRYIADKAAKGRRASTLGNLRNHLHNHWKPLHGRPLTAVTRAEVSARHRQLAVEAGPHAADRARSILSTFFVWAIGEGLSDANLVANTNTATVSTRRDRVLSYNELSAVWRASYSGDFGHIIRLLILTGLRRNEVSGMCRSEMDADAAVWTIPAARSKNKRPHEVPLSSAVQAIVAKIIERDDRDLVFGEGAGAFSGFSRAKLTVDKRIGKQAGKWSIHDLRRTVATRMADLGGLPHVIEAILNHVSGHKAGVAEVYNRSSYAAEKRAALQLWGQHVEKLVGVA